MTSVPPPAQTSLPLASIQSTASMLQNPITMTKVSWMYVLTSSPISDMLRSLFHYISYRTFKIDMVLCHSQVMNLENKAERIGSICCKIYTAGANFFHISTTTSV